jgi:hypothetical protein
VQVDTPAVEGQAPHDENAARATRLPFRSPAVEQVRAARAHEELHSLLTGEPVHVPVARSLLPGSAPRAERTPVLDRVTLARTLNDQFMPMGRGCAGAGSTGVAGFVGKIELEIQIVGDAQIGGIVDRTWVLEGTTTADTELLTCMRESLASIMFDAPPRDGPLLVAVSLQFPLEGGDEEADSGS